MKFTSLQITIINKISAGVIYDLDLFLKEFFEYESGQYVGGYFGDYYEFKNGQNVSIIKNNDDLIHKTAEFISLIEYLKSSNLIHVISKIHSKEKVFPLCYRKTPNSNPEAFSKFYQMVKDYHDKEFLPLPEIHSFIERQYKTNEEYDSELEKIDRKESQKLTRKIAYTTISISVIISLVTFALNYFTYTTERNVKITNTKEFKDTVVVKISKDIDSSKIDTNKVIK
jgi:hypothetical protein